MATISAALSTHPTLSANTADAVTIGAGYPAFEVKNRGASEIYYRFDGTTAVVGANNTYVLAAGESLVLRNPQDGEPAITVSVISTGAIAYSVTGAQL